MCYGFYDVRLGYVYVVGVCGGCGMCGWCLWLWGVRMSSVYGVSVDSSG